MDERTQHLAATNPWRLIREQMAEIERLHQFALRLANRLADASEVLGRVAERRKGKQKE